MKTIKIILVIFSTVALFAACSKDNATKEEREELVLSGTIGIAEEVIPFTRATQKVFEPNTKLKVIVRDNSGSNKFLVEGDKTTIATTKTGVGDKNALECAPILFWDDLGGKEANLSLFGIFPDNVPLDVNDESIGDIVIWDTGYDQSSYPIEKELMFAQNTGYTYANKGTPAHLNFEHVLSKITITINVDETQGFDATTLNGATVTFKNIPLKAGYSIVTNECTIDEEDIAETVTPARSTNTDSAEPAKTVSYSYTILCAPHEYTGSSELGEIAVKGNTYKIVVPQNLTFNRGEHTTVTVELKGSDVTATASLTDWVSADANPVIESRIVTFEDFVINDIEGNNVLTNGSTIRMAFTDKATPQKVHNALFTYNDTKWEATTPVFWDDITTAISGVEALLTVYQPTNGEHYFTGKLENTDFTKADAITNGSQIDLDQDDVKFFSHPLSKVEIKITTSGGEDKIDIDNIKLGSVIIKGKVNYVVGTTAITQNTTGEDLTITNTSNTNGTGIHQCIIAYIWPQALKELCQVTVDGNTYYVQANGGSDYTFEPGKHYIFTVKITKTGISTTASLKDWEEVVINDIETQL